MRVRRRDFLAWTAVAAAVAAVPAEVRAALPPAKATLDDEDRRILRLFAADTYGPGAEAVDIVGGLEATLRWLPEDKQALVVKLPALFDQLSRVLVPTGAAWSALGPEARVAALRDWETSAVPFRRVILQALRQLLLAAAYTNPDSFPSIGYPGPWKGRVAVPVHPPRFGEPEVDSG